MLIDSHAHITQKIYDDIGSVLERAKENNVLKIINCGDNLESSKEIISLSKTYDNVLFCTVGIHPEYAKETNEKDILELEKLIKNNKIYGIGEIGLDFYYGKEDRNKQIALFKKQLELATKYKLPVIIHSREATNETINILESYNLKGIIHCFTGSIEIAKRYIKLGYKLGIGGVVTFKNSRLVETLKQIKAESIVLETDSPYLTPDPYRKNRNEPKYIKIISEFISKNLNITEEELEYITSKNVSDIFDI